jgi:hypothetical protein
VRLWAAGLKQNSLDARPHPGVDSHAPARSALRAFGFAEFLSPIWNVVRLDWPDNLPPTGNLATACPLRGERKQVREVVKSKQENYFRFRHAKS